MQDEVVGWGEEKVPPQQDAVPVTLKSEPEPDRESFRQRWRSNIATAVLVVCFTAGAVAPVTLCVRGWNEAESARGLGAGRGVFTVAHCGDPQKDSDDNTTYTCTGSFARQGASPVGVSAASRIYSVTDNRSHKAGAALLARMDGDGDVLLADDGSAAAIMAVWFTAALVVVLVEGTAARMLRRWILGLPVGWLLDGPLSSAAFAACIAVAVSGGIFITAFMGIAAVFAIW